MAVTLKLISSDPMFVKPKCVSEVEVFLKNCKQTAEKFKQIFQKLKKLVLEVVPFKNFDLGHPVQCCNQNIKP